MVSLAAAIRNRNGKNAIIAEIKCASPSRGVIRRNVDMAMMAGVLEQGGCTALSVLTEPYFFGGTCTGYRTRQECREPPGPP